MKHKNTTEVTNGRMLPSNKMLKKHAVQTYTPERKTNLASVNGWLYPSIHTENIPTVIGGVSIPAYNIIKYREIIEHFREILRPDRYFPLEPQIIYTTNKNPVMPSLRHKGAYEACCFLPHMHGQDRGGSARPVLGLRSGPGQARPGNK